ncbi:MAG: hypothetical protein M5R36_03250 [Deltaproteobacteria bacterium]|nr:hypothetical protein [Deltaproteobacteria bacterium]
MFLGLIVFAAPAAAQQNPPPRTLFVIGAIDSIFRTNYPIMVYAINGDQLLSADEFRPTNRAWGAVGLAIDPTYEHLFVSYEASNKVDAFGARDATPLGTITLAGTDNIAGIDVLEERGQLFVVDRTELDIFVYDTQNFGSVGHWLLPTGNGAYDIDVVPNVGGQDVIFVTDGTETIRWYNIDTHAQVGSFTQSEVAQGLAVENKTGTPVVFTASICAHCSDDPPEADGHNYLLKYNTGSGVENKINLGDDGRGVAVNSDENLVYVSVGRYFSAGWKPPSIRAYDQTTLQERSRQDLASDACNPYCSPTDVEVTYVSYGSNLTKELISHPTGDIGAGQEAIFRITVSNIGSTAIDILPVRDTYDTNQLAYLYSNPASNNNVDDGTIDWSDLTVSYGQNLAPTRASRSKCTSPRTRSSARRSTSTAPTSRR